MRWKEETFSRGQRDIIKTHKWAFRKAKDKGQWAGRGSAQPTVSTLGMVSCTATWSRLEVSQNGMSKKARNRLGRTFVSLRSVFSCKEENIKERRLIQM